jgi:hypothetical protein
MESRSRRRDPWCLATGRATQTRAVSRDDHARRRCRAWDVEPFDIHNTLMAAGPDIREHATSAVPTSNVDIAPTLLRLLGMPVPPTMTGRVIEEALRSGRGAATVVGTSGGSATASAGRADVSARLSDGSYRVDAHVSVVGESRLRRDRSRPPGALTATPSSGSHVREIARRDHSDHPITVHIARQ